MGRARAAKRRNQGPFDVTRLGYYGWGQISEQVKHIKVLPNLIHVVGAELTQPERHSPAPATLRI